MKTVEIENYEENLEEPEFCPSCGEEVPEDESQCPECGEEIY